MAVYTINTQKGLDWSAKGHGRILQNISNLLNTLMYEIAYDRTLGRSPESIDDSKTQSTIIEETYQLIEDYEPRAKIITVEFESINGELSLKVVVDIE